MRAGCATNSPNVIELTGYAVLPGAAALRRPDCRGPRVRTPETAMQRGARLSPARPRAVGPPLADPSRRGIGWREDWNFLTRNGLNNDFTRRRRCRQRRDGTAGHALDSGGHLSHGILRSLPR